MVNSAGGDVIKQDAILEALRQGHFAGDGLDVDEDKRLRPAEESAALNRNVTCHAAFCRVDARNGMLSTSARIHPAAATRDHLGNGVN